MPGKRIFKIHFTMYGVLILGKGQENQAWVRLPVRLFAGLAGRAFEKDGIYDDDQTNGELIQ
jgi:hypothetical protein